MPQTPPNAFVAKNPSNFFANLLVDALGLLKVVLPASSFKNYSANTAGNQIKTGAGVLTGVNVNTGGTTSTLTLYDGTSTSGTKIGTWSTTALVSLPMNIEFTTGLFAVLAGGAAADVTVSYR